MAPSNRRLIERILRAGVPVKLQVEGWQGLRLHNGRIEGLRGNQVAVALPEESLVLLRRAEGAAVRIIREAENALYLIDAWAVRGGDPGCPVLTLRMDGNVRRVQRREDVRLSVLIDPEEALLIRDDEEEPIKAIILDISAGGLLLHTKQPLSAKARLKLAFPLPGFPTIIQTRAEVVRLVQADSGESKSSRVGVRFVDLDRQQADAIVRFVFREQARRRRLGRW